MKNNYKNDLLLRLKDKEYALGYLNLCMADKDPGVFLLALHDVIKANMGFKAFAKKTSLNREHMFRMLSKKGNPRLETLREIASGLGWRLTLEGLQAKNSNVPHEPDRVITCCG